MYNLGLPKGPQRSRATRNVSSNSQGPMTHPGQQEEDKKAKSKGKE